MLRNEHSRAKNNVERRNVNQCANKQSFKDNSNCWPFVSKEVLLAKGESSCFANNKISPLKMNDCKQECTLGIFNGLWSVANRMMNVVCLCAGWNLEESSIIFEQTITPLIRIRVIKEKSHINPTVSISCHIKSSCFSTCLTIWVSFARPSLRIINISRFWFYSFSNCHWE